MTLFCLHISRGSRHICRATRYLSEKAIFAFLDASSAFFAGCFNDIIAECDRCFIECDPRLVELYKRSFPTATIGATERTGSRFKPTQSYNWVPKTPSVDFSIEAGSLFQFVRSDWKKFSGKKPYLVPDKKLQASWKEYIKKNRFRVENWLLLAKQIPRWLPKISLCRT